MRHITIIILAIIASVGHAQVNADDMIAPLYEAATSKGCAEYHTEDGTGIYACKTWTQDSLLVTLNADVPEEGDTIITAAVRHKPTSPGHYRIGQYDHYTNNASVLRVTLDGDLLLIEALGRHLPAIGGVFYSPYTPLKNPGEAKERGLEARKAFLEFLHWAVRKDPGTTKTMKP